MAKLSSSTMMLVGFGVVVFGGLIAFAVFNKAAPSPNDAFAQCLTEKGVKMYGAWWCPHCAKQKALFGSAFDYVDYVECSPNSANKSIVAQECKDAGIEGYPTWTFPDGTELNGEQPLTSLGAKVGCDVP